MTVRIGYFGAPEIVPENAIQCCKYVNFCVGDIVILNDCHEIIENKCAARYRWSITDQAQHDY